MWNYIVIDFAVNNQFDMIIITNIFNHDVTSIIKFCGKYLEFFLFVII